jgi:ADP-heptose:LPS heptosyltransferase/GT2 family glycosyltransferase
LRIHLQRPASGGNIAPGGPIGGIGWVLSDTPVTAIDIYLDGKRLGQARCGLPAAEMAALIDRTVDPPAAPPLADDPLANVTASGFVFTVTAPVLPPGPTTLRLRARTTRGHCDLKVPLTVPPAQKPAATEPMRAMIETASLDERGVLHVLGWAVSLSAFEQLQVFLGEHPVGLAAPGLRRDDVATMLPEYANAGTSGFHLQREVDDQALRAATVRLVISAAGGVRRAFSAPLQRPARLRRPPPERLAKAACEELRLTDDGIFAVKGWAIAASGVTGITIRLADTDIATLTPDEVRPDVGNSYPRIKGAELSGFRLQQRLDGRPEGGRYDGPYPVRVTVRGRDGESATTTETVTARRSVGVDGPQAPGTQAPSTQKSEAIRFHLDSPACQNGVAIETVRGFLTLNGWAFGPDAIARIEISVDGHPQGRAHHGIRRDDLQKNFPGEDVLLSGFAMLLPPQVMKKGEHAVQIDVHDKAGRSKQMNFTVRADDPATGPGPWALRQKLPQAEIDLQHAILTASRPAPPRPTIHWTLLLTDSAPDPQGANAAALRATLESLRWQAYENWSLILLATSAESEARLSVFLDTELGDLRPRTQLRRLHPDSSLADIAPGFLLPLRPGDRLGEDALLELSLATALAPQTDFLYSDERRIDPADGAEKAFFKPDFSPELLLSTNYIGRLWGAAPALLRSTGITEADLLTHGDYDAVLRLTEQAAQILHVPKVLCARGRATEAGERRALQRAMRRRRIHGQVLPGPLRGTWRVQRAINTTFDSALVSIIIPTVASRGYIKVAIDSIRAHTAWPAYEIICLDNIGANAPPEQLRWKAWIAENADRTIQITERFNWSRFNNRGARHAKGAFLLFLNDDIEVTDPRWLHGLIEQAQRPEVGVVGPQLLYPDGRVQHAGMFLARRAARHAFRFYPRDEPGPFGLALIQRDVISVTGACMMMRREVFDALGGFDEAHAVVNNDLDFNLRVRASGLAVVYTPAVSLTHHEMVSRAELADTHNADRFNRAWGDLFLKGDPFFSRYFSPDYDDFLPDAEPVRLLTAGHPLFNRTAIRRILVVKVDHIGDFVIAFPAIQRLRALFPAAEITVLAARASLALAQLEPAIDRMIEFNFYHARSEKGRLASSRRELAALGDRLRPERFDLAIDLRRQPDTRPILQASGARWLAGFDRGYAYPWLDIAVEFEGDIARNWKREHASDSLLALVDAVAAQCVTDRTVVRDPAGRVEGRALLTNLLGAPPSGRLICVHTGAGAVNKQWPAASFAGLIDLLAGEAAAQILIIGGPDEASFAQSVIKQVRRRQAVSNLVGQTGLRDLPLVLRAADLYIGNDSGPKHIAAALGVPTIGVHSGSVDAGEWGALGPFGLTIRRDMTCSPCYLAHAADCPRALACLTGISVSHVYQACRHMLALVG